jgi:hypothetical protein
VSVFLFGDLFVSVAIASLSDCILVFVFVLLVTQCVSDLIRYIGGQ